VITANTLMAAAGQAKSANGALGLLFVLLLGVAVAFLLRSMNKHLRKAQRMKIEETQHADGADGTDGVGNVDLRKQA
jgi:flagellar biogenesis protein FliO